jgi:hypothetical protein
MSGHSKPLIGSVYERKPVPSASAPSAPQATGSKTGFPTAQHRSKSVFSRNREAQQQPATLPSRASVPPAVQQASRTKALGPPEELDTDDWRVQMSEENERRVAAMTEEERTQERREIEEKFGKNIGDVLRKTRMARECREKQRKAVVSSDGDLAPSRPDGDSEIIMPAALPGSYQSKCCVRGPDTQKIVCIVPTGTLPHLPFLLYA